jgi:16S rRNA (guanine966-N2)-methyltransferase
MRIIAGLYRGRPLKAPKGNATRPTTDRVREALFGILGDLSGCRVMDCYAGTGALGLEAVSRGASYAMLIESAAEACRVIEQNIASLGVENRTTLLRCEVERAKRRLLDLPPFDVILADPPWPIAQTAGEKVARLAREHLAKEGVLVLGHPKKAALTLPETSAFKLVDQRHWGDSAMSWFKITAPSIIQGDSEGPASKLAG